MCKVTEQGYQLKCTERIITSADLDTLTKEEMLELASAPVSAWEMLHLRKQNHHIINSLSAHVIEEGIEFTEIKDHLKIISDSLIVTVKNGREHKVSVAELVVDLHNLHSSNRSRSKLIEGLKANKYTLMVILVTLIAGSIFYHKQIDMLLNSIEGYLIPILGAGILAPLIVIFITNLFKKKP